MSRLSLKLLDNWASVAVLVLLLFLPVYGQVMTSRLSMIPSCPAASTKNAGEQLRLQQSVTSAP